MNWEDDEYAWVGDWIAKRASLSPDRTALIDETTNERYTYADLDERAGRTARLLERCGVESGERIAVVSRNRVQPFDLFFATGKTGGVLAPLSYRLAPPELAELLELVDPRLFRSRDEYRSNRREQAFDRPSEATSRPRGATRRAPLLLPPSRAVGRSGGHLHGRDSAALVLPLSRDSIQRSFDRRSMGSSFHTARERPPI